MDTAMPDTAIYFIWHLNTAGDSARPLSITVENITVENIYSHTDIIRIGSYAPSLTLKNIHFKNVSQSSENLFVINTTIPTELYLHSKNYNIIRCLDMSYTNSIS